MSYLFKALELLRGVDSLFALGTLLAHIGVTWVISAASGGKTRPPKNDLKWHLSPFTRSLLSICCVSPVLLGKISDEEEIILPLQNAFSDEYKILPFKRNHKDK